MSFIVEVIGEEVILEALRNHRESAEWIGDMTGELGASAPYAGFVHEGTVFMPARPFLSNAINRNIGTFKKKLLDAIPDGEGATAKASIQGLNQILSDAREETPVRTGRLRGSLYVKIR